MSPGKVTTVSFSTFHNTVNAEPRTSKNTYNGIDPTTKQKLWDVPVATQQDVEDAVTAASEAFKSYSKTTFEERKQYVVRLEEALSGYESEMVDLLAKETGKPVSFLLRSRQDERAFFGVFCILRMNRIC